MPFAEWCWKRFTSQLAAASSEVMINSKLFAESIYWLCNVVHYLDEIPSDVVNDADASFKLVPYIPIVQ